VFARNVINVVKPCKIYKNQEWTIHSPEMVSGMRIPVES
jgi:hypothetical protein